MHGSVVMNAVVVVVNAGLISPTAVLVVTTVEAFVRYPSNLKSK